MRKELDFIGEVELPSDVLYGIQSYRARENFPGQTPFNEAWYRSMGKVKLACYRAYRKFKTAALEKYDSRSLPIAFIDDEVLQALEAAALKVSSGDCYEHFIVPAVQGGAGTSINMNVNEVISNLALRSLGCQLGDYSRVDPFEHANVFQSTNDTVPSALRVACMDLLTQLESGINDSRNEVEKLESRYRNVLRQSYTQMQAALPSTYDRLLSTYNNALSRDWWRVSKCFERIKEINLGGGAVGTGLSIPRFFIMQVVGELQRITGFPVTRSENLCDGTANQDSLVEVHAILKAHAVNLEKIAGDIRLMSADLFADSQMNIPQRQVGSSIMPGKVNPVIPEFIISSVHQVYANDQLITSLCAQGCLDLNAYLPVIGHALLESLQLLINCNDSLLHKMLQGLSIEREAREVYETPSVCTAIIPFVGYHKAACLARHMKKKGLSIFEANEELGIIERQRLSELMQPEAMIRQGYSLRDL